MQTLVSIIYIKKKYEEFIAISIAIPLCFM